MNKNENYKRNLSRSFLGKRPLLVHWQLITIYLIIYDLLMINLSYFTALWLRFDCIYSSIPEVYITAYMRFAPIYSLFCLVVFWRLRLYKSIWRFASFSELERVTAASVISFAFHIIGSSAMVLCMKDIEIGRMPVSYYIFGAFLQYILVLAIRFSYRFITMQRNIRDKQKNFERANRVMLIGAGAAGQMILRELTSAKEAKDRICCIIDDNPNKWGRYVEGIPVVGGRDKIIESVNTYRIDKIYLAIPSASAKEKSSILEICKETGCELKNMPGLYQLVNGELSISAMKEVTVEDLLGRDPIALDLEKIKDYLSGRTILVTGGGGSIGSELCRQVAKYAPKQLIIFDMYENNAYDVEQELRRKYPELNLVVLIGSVRDSSRVNCVFETYKPEIVFHAAAHKHVPLMEESPQEAIKNNVFGTYKTAYAALANGCRKFVLISTDKAVNPTNVMGASKRICEMIIQSFDRLVKENRAHKLPFLHAHAGDIAEDMQYIQKPQGDFQTEFVAVRFGNVLGSNGSVIPLFQKQIAEGGPVTVTHPDIIRYFMTIPEAVSLVLQASTLARGGEIFVLDMGEPVKIDTLARNLIKLSGFKPDVDIKIKYTGLRPGEKLYEEKLMAEEGIKMTSNKLIYIGHPIPFDTDQFLAQLSELMKASYEENNNLREMIAEIVETYQIGDE